MIPEDRLKKILSLIEQNHSITVNELKSQLYVSAATIRRDLAELSKRGMIMRSFGGALSNATSIHTAAPQHSISGTPIGESASQLIKDRSTVFIGSSSLTLSMAAFIAERSNLTVVTDSMPIADSLCGHVSHLYCTGGKYLPTKNMFVGRQAAEFVDKFRFDACFISCDGLTPDGQLSYYGTDAMSVLLAAVKDSKKRILLCASEQIGQTAPNALLGIDKVDIIVTDAPGKLPAGYAGIVIETQPEDKTRKKTKT